MNHDELFDGWNRIKKRVNIINDIKYPKVGDVWVSVLGKNIGHEQNGSAVDFNRPVLVLRKFNNYIFWVVPLSTKQKDVEFYYNFIDLDHNKASFILTQIRVFSVNRFLRKLYSIENDLLEDIKKRVVELLQIENPQ